MNGNSATSKETIQSQQLPGYEEEESTEEENADSSSSRVDDERQVVLICPFHELPVHHHVPQKGWAYMNCAIEDCPVRIAEQKAEPIFSSVSVSVHPEIKEGLFVCFCEKHARVGMSQKERSFGRCFLTCRRTTPCEFFQWVD